MNTTIPRDVLFITMSVIWPEVVVMGHGIGSRSWVIEQRRFDGPLGKLDEWARETGLAYVREDGIKLKAQVVGIEEAEGVEEFCGGWVNTFVLRPVPVILTPYYDPGLAKYHCEGTAFTVATEYYENLAKGLTKFYIGLSSIRLIAYNLCLADILCAAKIRYSEAQP